MTTQFQPLPFGTRPDWQEVLQRPYLTVDLDAARRHQQMFATREAEQRNGLAEQLAAMNVALKAQRDKALADYIAAHTPQGGGGGGGGGGRHGGGSGGSSTGALIPMGGGDDSGWYDQIAAQYANQTPPPTPNFNVYPSTAYGANSVYANPYTPPAHTTVVKPRGQTVVGMGPHRKVTPPAKPKYAPSRVVLS